MELRATLIASAFGGAVAFLSSLYFHAKRRDQERRALAAALETEIDYLLEGLRTYNSLLPGQRSAALQLNEALPLPEPPFKEGNFRIYVSNCAAVGRFPRKVARATVAFYHILETISDRVSELNTAVREPAQRQNDGVLNAFHTFFESIDKALAGGEELVNQLRSIAEQSGTAQKRVKPSGWQRVGIVLSVIWFLGAVAYMLDDTETSAIKLAGIKSQDCYEEAVSHHKNLDCERVFAETYDELSKPAWHSVLILAVAPIPFGWLATYVVVWFGRWISAGFERRR